MKGILFICCLFLISCKGAIEARRNVENEFPNAKVIYQGRWTFAVIDSDNSVYWVECLNETNDKISNKKKISR